MENAGKLPVHQAGRLKLIESIPLLQYQLASFVCGLFEQPDKLSSLRVGDQKEQVERYLFLKFHFQRVHRFRKDRVRETIGMPIDYHHVIIIT